MSEELGELRRAHGQLVERVVKVETVQGTHAEQLGKVNELEKGMVKLNTQFSEFRNGTREDLGVLADGQAKIMQTLEEQAAARAQEKQDEADRREQLRKERDAAKESRGREMWNRYIGVAGLLVILIASLLGAWISTHGGL